MQLESNIPAGRYGPGMNGKLNELEGDTFRLEKQIYVTTLPPRPVPQGRQE